MPADAPAWGNDRAALWNAAEQVETRKNSTVAREYEIALPAESSAEAQRQEQLAAERAREQAEERQQAQERGKVADKFMTLAGKRERAPTDMAIITATGRRPRR